MRRLTNEMWGFDSNCFVCEPRNTSGLQIPFFHDEDAATVSATFTLDERFSGAPSYAHGGVLLAVLDEAMAWGVIAIAHRWAMTGETTTRFEEPVFLGRTYTVEARVEPPTDRTVMAEAVIRGDDGTTCARAKATFVVLGEAQAVEATGGAVDADYLAD